MGRRSEKRFLIITGKITQTFIFEDLLERTLNQIKFFFLIRLWGNVVQRVEKTSRTEPS